MKKRSTLLKVISILYIIMGGISLLSGIICLIFKDSIDAYYQTLGSPSLTSFSYIITIIGGGILLAAGIIAMIYRSKRSVTIMVIIVALYYIASLVYSGVTIGFSLLDVIGLILPLLYIWGWYQSN